MVNINNIMKNIFKNLILINKISYLIIIFFKLKSLNKVKY